MVAGSMPLRRIRSPTDFKVGHSVLCFRLEFTPIIAIASHMRRGRQEDSHEFLRYAIDALQKSCLSGHSSLV